VAWAVFGAAAAISLMYSPAVFDGKSFIVCPTYFGWDPDPEIVRRFGTEDCSVGHVRICRRTIVDDVMPAGHAQKVVGQWKLGSILVLGLLGGCAGSVVGGRLHWGGRRAGPLDVRLWFITTSVAFGVLTFAGLPGDNVWSVWGQAKGIIEDVRWGVSTQSLVDELGSCGTRTVFIHVRAMIVGWAIATIATSCGIRFPRRRLPPQAADYDDSVLRESGRRGTEGA
jgi:hypothetical protein